MQKGENIKIPIVEEATVYEHGAKYTIAPTLFKFQNPRNTTLHRFSHRPVGSTDGSERSSIPELRGPNGRIRRGRTRGVGG